MTSIRLGLMALALGACAKQAAVRAPAMPMPTKTLDIHHLCDDARFESMCTPSTTERPMQVDINLESGRSLTAFPA